MENIKNQHKNSYYSRKKQLRKVKCTQKVQKRTSNCLKPSLFGQDQFLSVVMSYLQAYIQKEIKIKYEEPNANMTSNAGSAVGLHSTLINTFPLSGYNALGLPSSAYRYNFTIISNKTHNPNKPKEMHSCPRVHIFQKPEVIYLHTRNNIRGTHLNPSGTIRLLQQNPQLYSKFN